MWTCPRCREEVSGDFEVCWNCGTTRDGVEDPLFQTADEAPIIPNSPHSIRSEPGLAGFSRTGLAMDRDDDFGGIAPVDLVDCYWARDEFEARHLAEGLIRQGIPAVADSDIMRMGLGVAALGAPYFSPRVRVRVEDFTKARHWLAHYESRRTERTRQPIEDDLDSESEYEED